MDEQFAAQNPDPETQPARESPSSFTCDRCGHNMLEHSCKIICPNCGHRFDCSDLNLYFD